jgi:hypothetical protein
MTLAPLARRSLAAGAALAAGLAFSAGCTRTPATSTFHDSGVPAGTFQLVAFTSCDDALGKLKQAAKEYVGPYGFGSGGMRASDLNARGDNAAAGPNAGGAEKAPAAAPAAPGGAGTGGQPNYSGTNTHEAGVDEPDLVKTDGRRILTISRGVLRVVDVATRTVTAKLDLARGGQDPIRWSESNLLLSGDRALVLMQGGYARYPGVVPDAPVNPDVPAKPGGPQPQDINGPKLVLVDLSGGDARVAASYTVDGSLVDARQVGSMARVVVRSGPRLAFPYEGKKTDAQRLAANKAIIDRAGPGEWLPRYEVTNGGTTKEGRVGCDAVTRPVTYSGTSMITVLSFDLAKATLGSGDPVTVVADGDTVYSNGPRLYVANDQRWRAIPFVDGELPKQVEQRTEVYKFDTARPGQPQYVGAGSVPGWLLNQYSMSEWDGHLRIATTTGQTTGQNRKSESTVYVLATRGNKLVETGKVSGLGKGERIYAVRFVGPVGYVVTFRQTDPLYTVDLHNPAAPKVVGELKISGYSAYLHPAGDNRLIGIGQEATQQGRVQGTQVSVFDVSNLASPRRIAQYHVQYGHSEAEFDPHAFLYWPATGLLVVPVNVYSGGQPDGGALVLKVSDGGLAELGTVSHPRTDQPDTKVPGQIRRSLVIDDVLWTVSAGGLKANDATSLRPLAWLES